MSGVKYDGEKPMMDLLPAHSVLEVAEVLTIGANKYSPDNWRKVPKLQKRYLAAGLRHIFAHMTGEMFDPEDGKTHLSHAICCFMFMLEDYHIGKSEEEGLGEPEPREHREGNTYAAAIRRILEGHNQEGGV